MSQEQKDNLIEIILTNVKTILSYTTEYSTEEKERIYKNFNIYLNMLAEYSEKE